MSASENVSYRLGIFDPVLVGISPQLVGPVFDGRADDLADMSEAVRRVNAWSGQRDGITLCVGVFESTGKRRRKRIEPKIEDEFSVSLAKFAKSRGLRVYSRVVGRVVATVKRELIWRTQLEKPARN
jgi:hypothetical protein